MPNKNPTKPRTRRDGENQTSLVEEEEDDEEDEEEEEELEEEGANRGGPVETVESLSRTLQAFLEKQQQREQAQELRMCKLQDQFGQMQQEIQLERLDREKAAAHILAGMATPPIGEPGERQTVMAAGSLSDSHRERQTSMAAGPHGVDHRERQLAAGSLGVGLGGRQSGTVAGSLRDAVDLREGVQGPFRSSQDTVDLREGVQGSVRSYGDSRSMGAPGDFRGRHPFAAAGSLGDPGDAGERRPYGAAGSPGGHGERGAELRSPGRASNTTAVNWKGPKMQPYREDEDIEHYISTFERIAIACRWPEDNWALQLVPLLTGKARAAYLAMDLEEAMQFHLVKAAILQKFEINPETYRDRFRASRVETGETPKELQTRLKELYDKWMNPRQKSKEEIGDAIVMEQFLCILNPELRTWIQERDPSSSRVAAGLAETFIAARRASNGATE